MVAPHPPGTGLQRHPRPDLLCAATTPVGSDRSDGQFPRHAAKRVGGRTGVQLRRHVSRAFRSHRRALVRPGAPGCARTGLQPQRPLPLGNADALHESDVRLDVPRRPRRPAAPDRGRRAGLHLRRPRRGDVADQPRVHRGLRRRGCRRSRLHVPHPDLQHHEGLRLGRPERRRPLRDDSPLRTPLLPELHQLRP